ncbi:DUF6223 family protein [Streptomyces sp. E2N166]|uniref:DUF6223 family protein n=1 Tax=Streptomyces sp. E2N166 TaxID=1851909 RepID=UPI000EF70376|nr:DUF6223 family protein [Streptomyces sp. E2N166]
MCGTRAPPAASAVPGCRNGGSGRCPRLLDDRRGDRRACSSPSNVAISDGEAGNGLVGAVAAVPLGVGAVFLGRQALTRSRRDDRQTDRAAV